MCLCVREIVTPGHNIIDLSHDVTRFHFVAFRNNSPYSVVLQLVSFFPQWLNEEKVIQRLVDMVQPTLDEDVSIIIWTFEVVELILFLISKGFRKFSVVWYLYVLPK